MTEPMQIDSTEAQLFYTFYWKTLKINQIIRNMLNGINDKFLCDTTAMKDNISIHSIVKIWFSSEN